MTEALRGYTGLVFSSTLFLVAACSLVATNRTVDRRARLTFLVVLVSLGIISIADWGNYLVNGIHPELRWVHTVSMAASFAVAPALPILIAHVIFPERHARPLLILMSAQAVLEFASIFGGFVFWVDEANLYHRGPLYIVYMASYLVAALYLVSVSVQGSRKYQSANIGVVFWILACLIGGAALQIVDPTVRTSWPAAIMAVALYFQFYAEMVLRTDGLTKLLNRHDYDGFLAAPRLPCVVVAIDVDNFKQVNDNFGHAYGDECLIQISELIMQAFGQVGRCYRTGGDEFTVMVTRRTDDVATRIDEFERLIRSRQELVPRLPGVSVGTAHAGPESKDLTSALKAADQAMYEAKRAKKAGR